MLCCLGLLTAQAQYADFLRQRGFVQNAGQVKGNDGRVAEELRFRWQGEDFSVAFLSDRFVYEISYVRKDTLAAYRTKKPEERGGLRVGLHRIEYIFPAGPARLLAENGTKSKISYPDHQGGPQIVPMVYDRLVYKNAFPDVDLVFSITPDGQCKYDVVVSAGAHLADVRFDVTGLEAGSTKFDGNQLSCELPFGKFVERVPEAYVEKSGERKSVKVGYAGSHRSVGFALEEGEQSGPLVVDPIGAIEWGTWFCPPGSSMGVAVVALPDGSVFSAGECFSGNLMFNTNTSYDALEDAWVAKFKDELPIGVLDATDLAWCNIQGGSDVDQVEDMDAIPGLVAVVGWTQSHTDIATDTDMHIDIVDEDTICTVNELDGFLMYFDAITGEKTYGTYIGGYCQDFAHAVAFDRRPLVGTRCYVTGVTASTGQIMPPVFFAPNVYQLTPPCGVGVGTGFIQRYGPSGIEWNSYYSSCSAGTRPLDIAVDLNGNAIMVAEINSSIFQPGDLGVVYNMPPGGISDLVLASFADDGSLNWARFCGTADYDGLDFFPWEGYGASLAIAPSNDIYVGWNHTADLFDTDTRIARIKNDPIAPADVWTTPLDLPSTGLACSGDVQALAVTCAGTIMVVGETNCDQGEYSLPNSHQVVYGGPFTDGYIIEVEDLGSSANIIGKSYYGGAGRDLVRDVSAGKAGHVHICGNSDAPIGGVGIAYNAGNGNPIWQTGTSGSQCSYLSDFSFECCPAPPGTISIPDGTTSTGGGYTNQTIRIEGDWYINGYFSLINCTVHAMPGSQIILVSGSSPTLYMENTHITACDEMWKGIHAVDLNTGVRMYDSSISDAQYGIWLENGTFAHAARSKFLNNYTGIYIKKPCNGCWNSVGLTLSGCEFRSVGSGLKSPYPLQLPVPGTIGYAGIDASGTYLSITSPGPDGDNIFHTLNYGITTGNVGFSVTHARFEDIKPDPAYGNSLTNGSAIYSTGYGGFYTLKQEGRGLVPNDPVTFMNCRTAIWTERMGLRTQNNKIEGPNAWTGVTARYGGGRTIQISNNRMDVQRSAVDLRFNDGATSLAVHDNDLTFGHPLLNGNALFAGLLVVEMNGTNTNSVIRNNSLHTRQFGNVYEAMQLSTTSGFVVNENYIDMAVETSNRVGIDLRGCTNTRLTCNNVQGPSSWTNSHWTQAGIRHSMGDGNYLACNNVTYTRHGILFNGYSAGTDLTANNFGVHDIGLELTQGALIGPQVAKGNIWNVQAATEDARWVGPSQLQIIQNQNLVNQGQNSLCMPFSFAPADWFDQTPQSNLECATLMPQCPSVNFQGGNSNRSQAMDEAVMQGVIQNGIYTDETKLTLSYELYTAMAQDPALYAGGPYTADFLALMQGGVTEQLKDVELPRKELYQLPAAVLAQVQANANSIDALMTQVATAQAQIITGGLSPVQVATLQADIAGWQQSIASLNMYIETAMASIDAAREVEAQLLASETGQIASNELIEQNAKAVNAIYLATIGITGEDVTFDGTQASELFAIASQCPLVGGNPVYQARSLYTLIDEDAHFDDALLCVAAGFAVKNEIVASPTVTVFPNPNRTGQLSFRLSGFDDERPLRGQVLLYDVRGQLVASKLLHTNVEVLEVQHLAQGLYQWEVHVDDYVVGRGKVIQY